MLDAVDVRGQGRVDPVPPHRVGGDFLADAVGLTDQRLQLGRAEIHARAQRPPRVVGFVIFAIGIELDPVGAVLRFLAHRLADLVGPVDDLHAFGHLDLPRISEQRVHAGRRHRTGGDEHARSGDHAACDGGLEIDVGVHRALGFQVADGGEAVHHGGADRNARPQRPVRNALFEQEPGVAEVDHFGGLALQFVRRSDLRDPVAFDQHRHAVARGVGVSIDQVRRLDQDALGRP